jgi:hypothetical protein
VPESLGRRTVKYVPRELRLEEGDLTYLDENFPSITNFIPERYDEKAPFIFEDVSEYEENCIPVIVSVPLDYQDDSDVYFSSAKLRVGDVRWDVSGLRYTQVIKLISGRRKRRSLKLDDPGMYPPLQRI